MTGTDGQQVCDCDREQGAKCGEFKAPFLDVCFDISIVGYIIRINPLKTTSILYFRKNSIVWSGSKCYH